MNTKQAILLAGGKGTRLRPYTVVLPKPLMPIGEFPILEIIVRQLVRGGFEKITMAVNHQAELIQAFFGNGEKWGVEIEYSLEYQPLGTIAPLKLIENLPDNFLVMNGDILTDLDFSEFYARHVQSESLFTISSHMREQKVDYGVLETDSEQRLIGFSEKPRTTYQVSMGIYMVNRAVLDYIPIGQAYGFDTLMLDLIASGKGVSVNPYEGYWLDIGRPDDYTQAIDQFESMKDKFLDG